MVLRLFLLVFVLFWGSPALPAFEAEIARFNESYSEYKSLASSRNWHSALSALESAYDAATVIHADSPADLAKLRHLLGRVQLRVGERRKAMVHFRFALSAYERLYGEKSTELIEVLLDKAVAEEKEYLTIRHAKRAVRIAKADSALLLAQTNAKVANLLVKNRRSAGSYFRDAYTGFDETVGRDDPQFAKVAFNWGKFEFANSRREAAIRYFNEAVDGFSKQDSQESRHFELITRAFLVQAYEAENMSDEATQHCLIIGAKKPFDPDADFLPVYKKAPKYPRKALRTQTQGSVIVEFTVDEMGFTRDHKVFKSSDSVFDRSAIAAVQEFRYAPQYKNGVAVPTSGVMNQILYEIR